MLIVLKYLSFVFDCNYSAENIKWLDLSNINGLNKNYKFKNTKDHSKWAITVNSAMYITCIGDINRAVSLLV